MTDSEFLPGVAVQHVLDRLAKAGGNEVESGKLASPESSAALAVNCLVGSFRVPNCSRHFRVCEQRFLPSWSTWNIRLGSPGQAGGIRGSMPLLSRQVT